MLAGRGVPRALLRSQSRCPPADVRHPGVQQAADGDSDDEHGRALDAGQPSDPASHGPVASIAYLSCY